MLTGSGIGPLAGGAFAGHIASQSHEHGAASGVPDIADLPIVATASAVGEIVTAYRLGLTREATRQLGDMTPHGHAAVRSETRQSGWRSSAFARTAGPVKTSLLKKVSRDGLSLIF